MLRKEAQEGQENIVEEDQKMLCMQQHYIHTYLVYKSAK